jgi:ribonuclease P protein component
VLLGQVEFMTNSGFDKINLTLENKLQSQLFGALRQRRDFLFVQQKGVRQVMTHFILQAAVKPASTASQLAFSFRTGVTASKKVGNAVARNRAKRRMRALFRKLKCDHAPSGTDYVLVARHSLVQAAWSELSADFSIAAKRIHKKLIETAAQE